MPKAIALLSGGLDSTLAVLALLEQKIDVTAVTFLTHFGCEISDRSSCSHDPFPAAEKFGFTVKLCHLADKFIEIVKNPKHGHGKNMNPCVDCRILMLKEAKKLMRMTGADFLVTGEVLGQRPMSQRRDSFPLIDREAEVEGLVLRPLSAKLLRPTKAEISGLVDRAKLYAFSGRTRKPQMALAQRLGLTEYPAPAGGCLLTDPIYSYRLKDLLTHTPDPETQDLILLQYGRHFRLSEASKIIVGRNQLENEEIVKTSRTGDYLFEVENYGSPVAILSGPMEQEVMRLASSITARYSDAKHLPEIEVTLYRGFGNPVRVITVPPAEDGILNQYRIEKKRTVKEDLIKFPE